MLSWWVESCPHPRNRALGCSGLGVASLGLRAAGSPEGKGLPGGHFIGGTGTAWHLLCQSVLEPQAV